MKKILLALIIVIALPFQAFAFNNPYEERPYKDNWGNSYKNPNNLYKDTDRDGVINLYDYNDRNRNIQTPYQKDYNKGYNNNYYNKQRPYNYRSR